MCRLVANFVIAIKSYYTVSVTFFNKSLSHKDTDLPRAELRLT